MLFSSSILPLIILSLIAEPVKSSTNVFLDTGSLTRGLRLNGGIFYATEPILFIGCLKECVLRRRCKVVTFHTSELRCELGYSTTATELSTDLFYVTTNLSQWPIAEELVGSCFNHTCPSGTMCTAIGKTQRHCSYTECSPPWSKAFVEKNPTTYTVGYSYTYSCMTGYAMYGSSSQVTCQPNGQWSSVNFNCLLNTCDTGSGYIDGTICFKRFSYFRSSSGAKSECYAKGARLAVIDNAQKLGHVKSNGGCKYLDYQYNYGHVDGSDQIEEGVWRYSDGSLATYLPWSPSYGSNGIGHNCLYLNYAGVEDISCYDWLHFLCEIP